MVLEANKSIFTMMKAPYNNCYLMLWLFLLWSARWSSGGVAAEMEATWTPNESDQTDGGPLPLSTKQRQELSKLEEAIRSSPDPQETLLKVAQANQMDPNDLVNMLNRNRQDLNQQQQGGGGRQQINVWQSLVQVGTRGGQWMRRHPRSAAGLGVTLLTGLYATRAMRTSGLAVSSTRRTVLGWSRGATTLFPPPTGYLQRVLERNADRTVSVDAKRLYQEVDHARPRQRRRGEEEDDDDDEQQQQQQQQPTWLSVDRGGPVRRAISVVTTLQVPDLKKGAKFESMDDEVVLESAWEQSVEVLKQQALTEFCTDGFMRFVADDPEGLLVVRGLGDWGGYGLLPLRRVSPEGVLDAEASTVALTLNTVKGAHFDGQIHIQLDLENNGNDADGVQELTVRVTLLTPKGGSAPRKAVAERIVQALHESLVASVRTRTRQALARQSQSARFQQAARDKATMRRNSRSAKERAIEEMAADRRRRWQRQNPNSGSYRPSGDRMRSPNNAVY